MIMSNNPKFIFDARTMVVVLSRNITNEMLVRVKQ
jgi:hypothetical protein